MSWVDVNNLTVDPSPEAAFLITSSGAVQGCRTKAALLYFVSCGEVTR